MYEAGSGMPSQWFVLDTRYTGKVEVEVERWDGDYMEQKDGEEAASKLEREIYVGSGSCMLEASAIHDADDWRTDAYCLGRDKQAEKHGFVSIVVTL